MSLRLAVATEDLNASLKKAIGLAAASEVHGVRLNSRSEVSAAESTESSIRQIMLYVKERQMKVAGLLCPTRHALYDSEYLEPRLDVIRKSMTLARKLEAGDLLVRCGRIPDPEATPAPTAAAPGIDDLANPFSLASSQAVSGPAPASQFVQLCEILNDLTRHGNHVGCTLNLQLSAYNQPLVKRLLAEVKAGPLSIAFDTATAVMTAAPVVGTFRDLYRHVGYVRARDALSDVDGAGVEVAHGDGVVDWISFLATLEESDYTGWVCAERSGGDQRAEEKLSSGGVEFEDVDEEHANPFDDLPSGSNV